MLKTVFQGEQPPFIVTQEGGRSVLTCIGQVWREKGKFSANSHHAWEEQRSAPSFGGHAVRIAASWPL